MTDTPALLDWVHQSKDPGGHHRGRQYKELYYADLGPDWKIENIYVVIVRFKDDGSYWIVPDSDSNNPEIGPFATLEVALCTLKLLMS